MLKNKIKLSIIILNYNSQDYLAKCLQSISKSTLDNDLYETIIVDNNSDDNSIELAKKVKIPACRQARPNTKYKILNTNVGFSTGNNQGIKLINPSSKYVFFLNPDTVLEENTLEKMISFFENNSDVDAATANLILVSKNQTQPECHRGFPTPWNSFWHFFGFGIPKLFPKIKFFNGYLLSYLDYSDIQKIDACTGACLMVKKSAGEKINWWNERYFFYGDDLDFCYKLKKNGFKLFFYPFTKVFHYQGISSGIKTHSKNLSTNSRANKIRIAKASTQAMEIFYEENLMNNYPKPVQHFIWCGIKLLEFYRLFKAKYL